MAGSVKISGYGTAAGGQYDEISISGAGKITGDVEAGSIRISGAGTITGAVQARELRISGSAEVSGAVSAGEMKISGAASMGGAVKAGSFECSGSGDFAGNVSGKQIAISGKGKFGGDVEAERFTLSGSAEIAGLLNAEEVTIKLGGKSRAREIGGGRIDVRALGGTWGAIGRWFAGHARLDVQSIEGDDIYLEQTVAQSVRGRRVRIGPGCRIEAVEYSESITVDPSSQVGSQSRSGGGSSGGVGTAAGNAAGGQGVVPLSAAQPGEQWSAQPVPGGCGAGASTGGAAAAPAAHHRHWTANLLIAIGILLLAAILAPVLLSFALHLVGLIIGLVLALLLIALVLALLVGPPVVIIGAIVWLIALPFRIVGWMLSGIRKLFG